MQETCVVVHQGNIAGSIPVNFLRLFKKKELIEIKYKCGQNPNSHIRTEEIKKKISESLIKRHKEKKWGWGVNTAWNKGLKGFRKGIPRHDYNEEFRKKISKAMKKRLANPEIRKLMRKRTLDLIKAGKIPTKDSKLEIKVEKLILKANLHYIKQWKYEMGIADFFLPKQNIVLEVDGSYWHSLPKRIEKDKLHNEFLKSKGYTVIRIPEADIVNNIERVDKMINRWS